MLSERGIPGAPQEENFRRVGGRAVRGHEETAYADFWSSSTARQNA